MYKVLIDSSVWIDYLRNGHDKRLSFLIEENLVCTNEIVLTELLPSLLHSGKSVVVDSLLSIECIPLKIDWQLIRSYQRINLKFGINKVGIPDLLILQQAIIGRLTLFSYDKHFELMKAHLNFELMH